MRLLNLYVVFVAHVNYHGANADRLSLTGFMFNLENASMNIPDKEEKDNLRLSLIFNSELQDGNGINPLLSKTQGMYRLIKRGMFKISNKTKKRSDEPCHESTIEKQYCVIMSISFPISVFFQVWLLSSNAMPTHTLLASPYRQVNDSRQGLSNHAMRMKLQKDVAMFTSNMMSLLIKSGSAHQLHVIYDDTNPGILAMMHVLNQAYSDVIGLSFSESSELLENVLKSKIYKREMRNIVVVCNKDNTLSIFDKVRERNLESPTIHWYVIMQNDYSSEMLNRLREGTQLSFSYG
ncbi:uncharacterized protein [Palaemon carinicauda]|uniref:uncharacterized protein n=1 Tax=Palaemon carinicauda TaxID=392227 RepID=UPI0035B581B4